MMLSSDSSANNTNQNIIDPDMFVESKNDNIHEASLVDDAETCPICFEAWTTSGPHRICCLKCGHLFGKSCVVRWLSSQGKKGKCPQCNRRAKTQDIRWLFCKRIQATDTTDLVAALKNLEEERKNRRLLDRELTEIKFKYQMLSDECQQLQNELNLSQRRSLAIPDVSKTLSTVSKTYLATPEGHFELVKSMLLSQSGNCRVLSTCDYMNLLCVSQPSINPIFKGYGIRKVHLGEFRALKYVHLHTHPIRDIALHADRQDGIVASASLDKTLKLTSLLVDQVVQTYQCEFPLWSCCWSSPNPNHLFAGSANGGILLFDVRVTSGALDTISLHSNTTPVTALHYLPSDGASPLPSPGGLLVGQLTQVSFIENILKTQSNAGSADEGVGTTLQSGANYLPHLLPLEGNLASLACFGSHHLLATYRPSQRINRVRHTLAQLNTRTPQSSHFFNEVNTFYGGHQMRMLSRSKLFVQQKINEMIVVACDEDSHGALVWRCDTGAKIQTIEPPDTSVLSPVLDVCPIQDRLNLAILNDRQLSIYHWR